MQVVKARGESMAAASAQGKPHGMLSVIGLSDEDLEAICADARAKLGDDTFCQIANFLFPQVTVAMVRSPCASAAIRFIVLVTRLPTIAPLDSDVVEVSHLSEKSLLKLNTRNHHLVACAARAG